jgi:hypothetical protein
MASSDSSLPPPPGLSPAALVLARLTDALKWQTAATLAAAIITASGRPYSVAEALEVLNDVRFALNPEPNFAPYQEWEKTKEARLSKVRV